MRIRTTSTIISVLLVAMLASSCGGGDDARDAGNGRPDASTEPTDTDEPAVSPGPADTSATSSEVDETFEVVFADGAVEGGPQALRVGVGDTVRIDVQSDADDEVHVHGIDAEAPVKAGAVSSVTFQVTSSGSYEVELHDSGAILGTVEVR